MFFFDAIFLSCVPKISVCRLSLVHLTILKLKRSIDPSINRDVDLHIYVCVYIYICICYAHDRER